MGPGQRKWVTTGNSAEGCEEGEERRVGGVLKDNWQSDAK